MTVAYIDDWYSTNSLVRKALEEVCSNAACTHPRYQHGTTWVQRVEGSSYSREIVHTAGTCTSCRCPVFHEINAITPDDVIDSAELLRDIDTLDQLLGGGGITP